MRYKLAIIVSNRPMYCEALKRLVEETQQISVIMTSDEGRAEQLAAELEPDILVIDRPNTIVNGLSYFSQQKERPTKVIVVGWDDGRLSVYTRPVTLLANTQNLAKIVGSIVNV